MTNQYKAKNIFEFILNKDYLYPILFFLISTFFVYFVVRPNLRQLVLGIKKIDESKKFDKESGEAINKIITIQSYIEKLRNDFNYLDELLPKKPAISSYLSEIEKTLLKNELQLMRLFINDINLIKKDNQIKDSFIVIRGQITGGFANFYQFLKETHSQNRLKEFDKFIIINESESTDSSSLKIEFELKTIYL